MKFSVKSLEQRILHLLKVLLSSEWDSISEKCIQLHQKQIKTTSIRTISSKKIETSEQAIEFFCPITTPSLTAWI